MPDLNKKNIGFDIGEALQLALLFSAFYVYIWLFVNPRLIYHGGGMTTNFPVFFKGWFFFRDFLYYPGGILEYASAFLTQFFYFSWLGALLITGQALLAYFFINSYLKTIHINKLRWLCYVPAIVLLILYTQYFYHFTTMTVLLTSLICARFYLEIRTESQFIHAIIFVIFSLVFYYIAGGAFLLFAVLCGLYELFFAHRGWLALCCLLSALVVPVVVGYYILSDSFADIFTELLPISWRTLHYQSHKQGAGLIGLLWLVLPVFLLIIGFWRTLRRSKKRKQEKKKSSVGIVSKIIFSFRYIFKNEKLRWLTETLLLFAVGIACILFSCNYTTKALFEIDYYVCNEKWSQTLRAAKKYPESYFAAHAVNRALYYTGRLGYDCFDYQQHYNALFLTAKEHSMVNWNKFGICFDMGLINPAENNIAESMEVFGPSPLMLKRFALINIIKNNIGAAKIYLNSLSRTLFDSDWAENYLTRLEDDPNLVFDTQIKRIRSFVPKRDFAAIIFPTEKMLLAVLEVNNKNQMAFEYLMSYYMMTGQLGKFVQNLDRLENFNYTEIPPLYEQAMLLYVYFSKKPLDLKGRKFSDESQKKFESFLNILAKYNGDKKLAFNELAEHHSNSFLFYYMYARSGLEK